MMDDWTTWLGIGIGAGGLFASIAGVVFAFLARRAAKSAEQAAKDAREALSRNLSSVDIERAVELINRLKDLHRNRDWGQAIWLYQILRRTLTEICVSLPSGFEQSRKALESVVPEITQMENQVGHSLRENLEPEDVPLFDEILNGAQQELESLQSNITYGDSGGGA